MIKNERFATGLKKYLPYVKLIDQSKTSDQYFRLFDVPDKLYVGKNSFRIRVNRDTLVKASMLYIDIIDSTGEVIFHEITELTGDDGSRLIVIHVYEDTPPGEATIYIGGRASYDVKNKRQLPYSMDPGSSTDFIDFPNLMWEGKVVVIPTDENENEIIYAKPPIVKVKERFEEYKTYASTESRRNQISGSFKVSINPIISAYEYSDTSKSGIKIPENALQVILDPIINDGQAQSRQEIVPQYSELPTLYDANGNFTEDFKGGEIVIRGLTQQLNVAGVTVPDFSCSIIEVLDKNTVKISPPFKFVYGERNDSIFKTIKDATNVTASYYTTKTNLITNDSESFMQLEFENLEPLAGKVDSVALSYKPFGTFGEFVPIGQFRVRPQEYLVDSSSLVISKTELIEREIGKPTGSGDFDNYWELLSGKYNATYGVDESQFAGQGVTLKSTTPTSSDDGYDFKMKLKSAYGIDAIPNTEFKISFTLNLPTENSIRNTGDFQLDVFISGSSILRDTITNKDSIQLITDLSEGERVSSLTKKTAGAVTTYTYYFKTLTGGKIYPVFVFNNAVYFNLKNISIQPRNEFGYSPNQARLFVPLETLKTNTELVLNVEYNTKSGKRSKVSSQVYGLFFTGSGIISSILDQSLTKSDVFLNTSSSISNLSGSVSDMNSSVTLLSGSSDNLSGSYTFLSSSYTFVSESVSNTSIKTSGSSLYSFDPGTSGFSPIDGIFLGFGAGGAAKFASQSIFIGSNAGLSSYSGSYSNFIGYNAGRNAVSSSFSIYIGFKAGQSDPINAVSPGPGNIVIGNAITVPNNSEKQINIGGLIFGSGSHFPAPEDLNSSGVSFSGSANGKIGINQPNPKYSFDVSGSGNYTNGLKITGSAEITGSLILTGSLTLPINVISSGASYTFTNSDYTVIASFTSAATIYLPPVTKGRVCIIKNINKTNDVAVSGSGIDTIDGNVGYTLGSNGRSIMVQGDSGNWFILANV